MVNIILLLVIKKADSNSSLLNIDGKVIAAVQLKIYIPERCSTASLSFPLITKMSRFGKLGGQ